MVETLTVNDYATKIQQMVQDPQLVSIVVRRVALAAADGMISRSELDAVLKRVAEGRRNGTIRRPGAYFVTCAKELFARANVPWSNA